MRIVAGTARGRPLRAPHGSSTRPTSDKVRAAVFNVLGQFFEGGAVLDLYAGTGALALEALSRGFERAVCVERDGRAAGIIKKNAEVCGFTSRVEVREESVERALSTLPGGLFRLAFADPPYETGPELALEALPRLLAPEGRVVAEHDRRRPLRERYGALAVIDRRSYGTTQISIYQLD